MKTVFIMLACAAAGLIGAVGGIALSGNGASNSAPGKQAPAEWRGEIEELTQQVANLSGRMTILEKAPPMASAPVSPAVAPTAAGTDPEQPTAALDPATDEALQERVREIVNERQKAQWDNMGRGFMAMAKQREAGMIKRLEENHGLAPYQSEQLTTILDRRRQAISEFFRSMMSPEEGAEPMDMTKIREKITKVTEETEEEIKNLLSPDQYEAFQSDSANRRGGPFGGGRMGGGGSPGGGR